MRRTRDVPSETELSVWRHVASTGEPPDRVRALPIEQIEPLIRLAFRRGGWPHLTIPKRVIFDHEILLILAGKGDLVLPSGAVSFAAHDVLFVRPFVPHTFAGRGNVDHIAIHFDFSTRSGLEPVLSRRKPYVVQLAGGLGLGTKQRVAALGAVERSLLLVVENFASGTPEGRLRARGEFLCALSALLAAQGRPRGELGRRRARLDQAVALMRERLADHISSEDLQGATGLGTTQLNALFHELTGYSPMDYLRHLRIELARELLANPNLSIKEVAAQTGFSEPNYFSRVFARVDGVPPKAFREALLNEKSSRRP